MLKLVDTHCHIHTAQAGLDASDATTRKWHEAAETDPDRIIDDAAKAGVKQLICVGTDLHDSLIAVDFVENRANCYAAIGVHPHEAKDFPDSDIQIFRDLIEKRKKIVAIGEVGLDYYYEHSPKKRQIELLEAFLHLAKEYNLPVIFHVRDAYEDFWSIFDNFKGLQGVLHSFTATTAELDKALAWGLFIGLNGIMTFTKDQGQLEAVKAVPLDRLLLETDAPYLTPAPYRGKVCKSEHVSVTAEFLAKLRGEPLEELASATTENVHRLFGI